MTSNELGYFIVGVGLGLFINGLIAVLIVRDLTKSTQDQGDKTK